MENFEFVSPTHFVFGRGAEEQVGEKLAAAGAKRVLVHFGGGSAVASGLIDRVGASLDAAGIEHLELGGVRPNPEIGGLGFEELPHVAFHASAVGDGLR